MQRGGMGRELGALRAGSFFHCSNRALVRLETHQPANSIVIKTESEQDVLESWSLWLGGDRVEQVTVRCRGVSS